jgi:hypothetical protein
LPAGHAINLKCGVRYGLLAAPAAKEEVVANPTRPLAPGMRGMQAKMQRLQAAAKRRRANGGDLSSVQKVIMRFGPLMQHRRLKEAEALLDKALKLIEPDRKSIPRKNGQ